jgi:hypothetical protein
LLDVVRLRGVGFFGIVADAFLFVELVFAGVFLAAVFCDCMPWLPGRLSLARLEVEAEPTVIGSLTLRGISMDREFSSSFDVARERGKKKSRSI